jgi:hypothetical protein
VGKAKRNHSEISRERKLSKENKELRRENSRLRKLLSRFDSYDHIKGVLEKDQEERVEETQKILEDLKKLWKCHDCSEGVLEITLYQKLTQTWYYRSCNCCGKRTPGKRYTNEVKGIIKKTQVTQ